MKKALTACILLLALCLNLTACGGFGGGGTSPNGQPAFGSSEGQALSSEAGAVRYTRTTVPIPKDNYIVANVCYANSEVYIFGYEVTDEPNNYYIYSSDMDGNLNKQIRCVWDDSYDHSIMASDVDENGVIWLLEYVYENQYDSEGRKTGTDFVMWMVEKFDERGFSGAVLSSENFYGPMGIAAYDGKFYLWDEESLSVYSYEGEQLSSSQELRGARYPCFSPDGQMYVYNSGIDGYRISAIDSASLAIENSFSPDINITDVISGAEYDIYVNNGSTLFGYDAQTGEFTEILNWLSSGVNGDGWAVALGDSRFLYFTSREIYLLEPSTVKNSEVTTLTLATMDSFLLADAVIDFNASNDRYFVEVIDYSQYNTNESPEAGFTRLNMDIVTGNAPDILDLSSLPGEQYAKSGTLEDLYPYIEADERLADTKLIECVLEAVETDGHLFTLIPCYDIITIEGKSSQLSQYGELEFKDLTALSSSMGEGQNPFGTSMSKRDFIETMLYVSNCKFLNWSSGECYFDSDEFIALMEFAAQLPDEADPSQSFQMMDSGEQLVSVEHVGAYEPLVALDYYFGFDLGVYGIPSITGSGALVNPYISLGISASSANKDGAWEFLEMFLSDEYQADCRALPITEYGMNFIKEDFAPIKREGLFSLMDISGHEVVFEARTEICEQLFNDLLDSLGGVYSVNKSLADIVWDEAKAYFAGSTTAERAAELIQSRASIYVAEQCG